MRHALVYPKSAAIAEKNIIGQSLDWLRSREGNVQASFFARFSGMKKSDISVVFDTESKVIYWIGPTSVLPPNAPERSTTTL